MDFVKSKGMQRNNLVIFDSLNLAFRWKHSGQLNFVQSMVDTIESLSTSYGAKEVIILGDWGSSWRKAIYPEYKANRTAMREKQTEKESKAFALFLEEYNRAFESLAGMYKSFKYKGVEADDIAAYIAINYSRDYDHTWLISSDKDWDLLINDKISRFSYVTRKEVTIDNWDTHYPYAQEDHISVKVLQGDSGDNVPGVSGVGEKRAVLLLEQYGTALDIYDQIPIDSKYKYVQNLNEFKDQILLNYELMDLPTYCEDAIGFANVRDIKEEML